MSRQDDPALTSPEDKVRIEADVRYWDERMREALTRVAELQERERTRDLRR